MGEVSRYGLTVANIVDSGNKTKQMDLAFLTILTEMFMKASGQMTRLMEKVNILIRMEQNM